MHAAYKKYRRKITGRVKLSPEYKKSTDLVQLWVLLTLYMKNIVTMVENSPRYNGNFHT